ncbi:MAG TPA: hypothetical protein DET40_00640 [Lentisphaeria bacterium]|nr:MAG: hypothetical protein A2X45_21115 [Lentisphaerae bacterium GWF2_50_93]HCE42040.1 hypothetical protein [Lentisphaeria bacterium]
MNLLQLQSLLASKFNFEFLVPGTHKTHKFLDAKEYKSGFTYCEYLWYAEILPIKKQTAILALGNLSDDVNSEKYMKCLFGILDPERSNFMDYKIFIIKNDPIFKLLSNFDMFINDKSICLDGIGYSITVITKKLETNFIFNNPMDQKLREIEKVVFQLSKTIAYESKTKLLNDFMKEWECYLNR